MRVLHRWTIGKQADEPQLNEDAFAFASKKGIYCLSDGASQSFASARWARLLTSRFVQQPVVDETWLQRAIQGYHKNFDRSAMTWSAQGAFDQGSFATLLGVKIEGAQATILSIGDSLAVLDDGNSIQATFPYDAPDQFLANPLLLSTRADKNSDIFCGELSEHWTVTWSLSPRSKLFCMTDALGAWLLSDREAHMDRLRRLQTKLDFIALVEAARNEGTMPRDDTTLLVIG